MNHKVLLADDSLTIQKVIKITLANQPYEITEASSEDELFHKLTALQPKLVFLDFNLSEKYTGYELTTKIKSTVPSAKVLLLLGTFDTIDDAAMEKCGASDKIVKPFDSNKFIAICKHLIDTFSDEELAYPETTSPSIELKQEDPEDQWTVSHTSPQAPIEPEIKIEAPKAVKENPLLKEVSDWGMSIPSVIDGNAPADQMINIPPVIGEVKNIAEVRAQKVEATREDIKFPQSDDLEYPVIDEPVKEKPAEAKPTSKLISIESFNAPVEDEFEIQGSYVPEETDVSSIEAQIADEVSADLWQADEFEDLKKEVSNKIEEVKSHFQPTRNDFDESLFKPLDDPQSIDWNDTSNLFTQEKSAPETVALDQVDMSALREEMESMVKKYVKEYMDDFFKKNAEKVAWEVIPDLAENLIRQELSKISNKIIND